jgi:hypothetical protein
LPPLKAVERFFQIKGIENPALEAAFFDSMLDGVFLNYVMDPEGFPLESVRQMIIARYK